MSTSPRNPVARQLDNSFVRISQRPRAMRLTGLVIVIGACLALGLAMAIFLRAWVFAGFFGISIVGLAVYSFLTSRTTRKLVAAQSGNRIDWESALPEVQRESLNLEVLELSRILEVSSEQISDLQSAYIVAEDLALRQIQQEEQVPLLRHVSIGSVPFDAILVKQDVLICAEVAFLVAPDLRQERIDSMLRKAARVRRLIEQMNVTMTMRLMIILVTQLASEDEERLRKSISSKRFSNTPVDVDIRLLDFEALQRIYVTD